MAALEMVICGRVMGELGKVMGKQVIVGVVVRILRLLVNIGWMWVLVKGLL